MVRASVSIVDEEIIALLERYRKEQDSSYARTIGLAIKGKLPPLAEEIHQ